MKKLAVVSLILGSVVLAIGFYEVRQDSSQPNPEPAISTRIRNRPTHQDHQNLRTRSAEATKTRISYLSEEGLARFEEYDSASLDRMLRDRLKALCDDGNYKEAIATATNEAPGQLPNLAYTICAIWANQNKNDCLAWLLKSGISNECLQKGLMGIFTSAAQDTSQEGRIWVKDMLEQAHEIPGFNDRLKQVAKGWVTSGILTVDEYVSWWQDFSAAYPEELAIGSVYSSLYAVAYTLYQTDMMAGEANSQNANQATSDSEMILICDELKDSLSELSKSVTKDASDPNLGQMLQLSRFIGKMSSKYDGMAVPLDANDPPGNILLREPYFAGVGEALSAYHVSEVVSFLGNSKNPSDVGFAWKGYIESRSSTTARADLINELNNSRIPGFLVETAAEQVARRMIEDDSLAASKEIAALPSGPIRNTMIQSLVGFLDRIGRKDEAKQWRSQLPPQ